MESYDCERIIFCNFSDLRVVQSDFTLLGLFKLGLTEMVVLLTLLFFVSKKCVSN